MATRTRYAMLLSLLANRNSKNIKSKKESEDIIKLRWCSSAKHAGLSSPRPGFKSPAEHLQSLTRCFPFFSLVRVSNFPAKSLYPQVLPPSARRTHRHQKLQTRIETFLNSVPSVISAVINYGFFRLCR